MPVDNETIGALRSLFRELAEHEGSRLQHVGRLCGFASKLQGLECCADTESRLHVFVNGAEVFDCTFQDRKDDFRNLLAVMAGFAKELGEASAPAGFSHYKLDCVIKPPPNGEGHAVRLETVNTASEQRFCFSKV